MCKKLNMLASTVVVALAASSANAEVQWDGFMTAGASWHDDKNKNRYIGSLGDRGVQNDVGLKIIHGLWKLILVLAGKPRLKSQIT